jgi:hypothetical protein
MKGPNLYYRAYVDIHEWHDNEGAYNFVQRLKNPSLETRFVYNEDDWWVVEINKKPWMTKTKNGNTIINWLVDNTPTVNEDVDPDWLEIEHELSETHIYRQLEYELCL